MSALASGLVVGAFLGVGAYLLYSWIRDGRDRPRTTRELASRRRRSE